MIVINTAIALVAGYFLGYRAGMKWTSTFLVHCAEAYHPDLAKLMSKAIHIQVEKDTPKK